MFIINNSYNFITLAPTILGGNYTNMKVIGIITAKDAMRRSDIVTKHNAVKPIIAGLPADPTNLTYVVFEDSSGNEIVLAQEYIDPTTIVQVTTIDLDIKVFDVTPQTEAMIKIYLKEMGVGNFVVNVV